jgi:hypothetical protein
MQFALVKRKLEGRNLGLRFHLLVAQLPERRLADVIKPGCLPQILAQTESALARKNFLEYYKSARRVDPTLIPIKAVVKAPLIFHVVNNSMG